MMISPAVVPRLKILLNSQLPGIAATSDGMIRAD